MCSAECAIGTVCPIFLTAAHSLLSLVVTLVLLITAAVALGAAVGFGPAGATATANTTVALAAYGVVCSTLCTVACTLRCTGFSFDNTMGYILERAHRQCPSQPNPSQWNASITAFKMCSYNPSCGGAESRVLLRARGVHRVVYSG